jgi:G3E family GTPase
MVGGFLGAGKTTAILKIAQHLHARGLRVGLITNDQSFGLVDTAMLSSHGFPVEEITGGCFCCKFNSLVEASDRLSAQNRPDVFIAEPVGSCTDLKATVDYPLRRMYGQDFAIAPLSVMVDPVRALRILGLEAGKSFSPKVSYIYCKQLEEAEVIVVNKIDLLAPQRLEVLRQALAERFPTARVQAISARRGEGIEEWLEHVATAVPTTAGAMDVDYATYAEGEALLGWLNCTLRVSSDRPFDGNAAVLQLAGDIQDRLRTHGAEVAHLKMTLSPEEGNDLAVANLVRSDHAPELSHRLDEPLDAGHLTVNLRAEARPEVLREAVLSAVTAMSQARKLVTEMLHLESFQPGKPTPVHRLDRVERACGAIT